MTNTPVANLSDVRQKIARIIAEDWSFFAGVGQSELGTADRILAALTPASAEPVAYQVAMSDGRWGTIFHHPDKPLGDHRPLYSHPAPVTELPDWIARCCQCNRLVDTRENDEGGDIHGCQMDDGTWVCCGECWEKAAGVAPDPVTVEAAAKVLLGDDIAISKMAEAVHDGPLGADDHWFSAARPQGAWCVEVVRAALRALSGEKS